MKLTHAYTLSALMLASFGPPVGAVPIGHHGGMILDCKPPQFFDETPGADSKVVSLQSAAVTASDDTDTDTIKFWINNQPVMPKVTQEPSGRYHIEAALPAGVTGRLWLKVEAYSHEGCDNFKSWFVNLGN